jgi:hypothetical protein
MKLKPIFISFLVLAGLLLSAFGSLPSSDSAGQLSANQITVTVPPVIETVIVPGTAIVPVTGTDGPAGWTLIIYGLLALMGIAFLLALFAPRRTHDHVTDHDHHDSPPHDH